MLSKITKALRRLIMGFFMLYGYNVLVPPEAIIPINLITVLILTLFGLPGLMFLVIIRFFIY